MDKERVKQLKKFADKYRAANAKNTDLNFFSASGSSYWLENPTSNLLALFMGNGDGRSPTWLAKALALCVLSKESPEDLNLASNCNWNDIVVERESCEFSEKSGTQKRLDLVIDCQNFIIGIEHKVYAATDYNPFDVYDKLLLRKSGGRPIFKCILKAVSDNNKAVHDWPVVSYNDLISSAKRLYAEEVSFLQFNKWHIFYIEFLNHLQTLSRNGSEALMDDEVKKLVKENFSALLECRKIFNDFLSQHSESLRSEGIKKICDAFLSINIESEISGKVNAWGDMQAIRYSPSQWKGESNIVLIYEENKDAQFGDSQIKYHLNVYLKDGSTIKSFNDIKKQLDAFLSIKEEGKWCYHPQSNPYWFENSGKWLCFTVYPEKPCVNGALDALGSLAIWIQKNIFDSQ